MKSKKLVQAYFYNNPDNYPPIINGVRLLANADFRVELYCRDDGKDWKVAYPESVKVVRLKPQHSSTALNFLGFCRQALRHANRDTVAFIGHDMHGLVPARVLAGRYGRSLIYHCYDYSENGHPQTFGSRLIKTMQSGFARKAELVTVPDQGLARVICDDLHLNRSPTVMVNSPLAQSESKGALKSALRDCGREFEKIVFRQGRIGSGHGLEVTIHSLPLWANPNWGFVVMGIGEDTYADSLRNLAHSLGVANQFVALPPVAYDRVPEFTKDADLGHALYEPIHINNMNISGSCKIHEYMAAGLPLLVSDRPSLRSLVEEFACGVAADDASPEAIAVAINNFFGNGQAASMGRAAAEAFQNNFRFEIQFQPVLRTLEELVRE